MSTLMQGEFSELLETPIKLYKPKLSYITFISTRSEQPWEWTGVGWLW